MNLGDFKGKRVLIMGLGLHGGGAGAAEFFSRLKSRVVVTDLHRARDLLPSLQKLKRSKHITFHLGAHRESDFRNSDYVIQNPGVPDSSRFLKVARAAGIPVLSDIEIFFRVCPAPVVGITGTKGKSTTTWLIGEFLKKESRIPGRPLRADSWLGKNQESRVWVGGNIRKSMLDFLPRVRKKDFVVLELSSFQLDSLKRQRLSPHISVITSIFPDHLNRYPSMRAYIASKANIFRFQKKDDVVFVPANDRLLGKLVRGARGETVFVSTARTFARFRGAVKFEFPTYQQTNIGLAIAVAKHLGVGDSRIRSVLAKFRGLPGRMEFLKQVSGIAFVNDTTATNPQASFEAVRLIRRRIGTHGLHVIAGGFDKGLPARAYVGELVKSATTVIFLPGTATMKMESGMKKHELRIMNHESRIAGPEIFHARSMRDAVQIAYRNARAGDTVLLSPGAASFGLFKNEFDRGDQFVAAVRNLRPRT